MNRHSDPPVLPDGQVRLSPRQIQIVFIGLMAGMLLGALDQTVVSTALPTIVGELGGLEHLSWVITAYLLTATTSMPLYGKLSDIYGRKVLYQFGIVVFLIGSLLSGLSQNMVELILFRGMQGLGAGGIMTMAQAIIGDLVSPRERGRYQGYLGTVFAVSAVAGPLLGGFFTDQVTWRWVFYINIPVGVAALAVSWTVLRLPARRFEHRIDYLGAALLVSGVSSLLLLATWGGVEYAWDSPTIIGLGVLGAVLIGLFVLQESKVDEPLLPLRLFAERVFSVANAIGFILGMAMFGAIAYLPLYFQVVRGTSATMSGLRLLPLMAGMMVTSVASGQIISRVGRYRVFPIVGTAVMAVGAYLLSRLSPTTSPWEAAVYMTVLGIGLGLVLQVIVLAVQNAAPHEDLGAATAGVNLFRSLGSAFGVSIFGSILNNRLSYHLAQSIPADVVAQIGKRTLTASPEQLKALPPAIHDAVVHSFSLSLQTVFLSAVPLMVVAFLVSWLLREIPLREYAHVGRGEGSPPELVGEAAEE